MGIEDEDLDIINAQKIEKKRMIYAEILKDILSRDEKDFLKYISEENDFNILRDIWGALVGDLKKYKTGSEERRRIGKYVAVIWERLKEIKNEPESKLKDLRALTHRKEK